MAKAKRVKGIKCNAAASAGIKLVLVTRFEEMHALREAALNWSDPEGVHSMRVASRRLRSAVRDLMPYLRKRGLTSVLKQLKSIADALGEVRDQDVAIIALEKTAAQAPDELSTALEQLVETRKELREQARKELKTILGKNRLKELKTNFVSAVNEATLTHEQKVQRTQSAAEVTFLKMAKAVIQDRLRELEKLSNGLYKPFDAESLHDMRIAAKRLRYAIELFQQCWGHAIATCAKRAARIQSALGDVHDCDVWIESCGKHVVDARKHKQSEQAVAFEWLLDHYIKLRTRHLRQAFARWRQWEARETSSKLRAALHSEVRVKGMSADPVKTMK